jgi:hypothetical protein
MWLRNGRYFSYLELFSTHRIEFTEMARTEINVYINL